MNAKTVVETLVRVVARLLPVDYTTVDATQETGVEHPSVYTVHNKESRHKKHYEGSLKT
jgi:hypothetical protein